MQVSELISNLHLDNVQLQKDIGNLNTILLQIYQTYPDVEQRVKEWLLVLKQSPGMDIALNSIKPNKEKPKTN